MILFSISKHLSLLILKEMTALRPFASYPYMERKKVQSKRTNATMKKVLLLLCMMMGLCAQMQGQNNGGGGDVQYIRHDDGSLTMITRRQCNFCGGTTICRVCGGQGGVYGYMAVWYPCTSCLQSTKCRFCAGKGVIETRSYVKDGYGYSVGSNGYNATTNPGGTIVNGPRGRSVYPKGGRSGSDRRSGSGSGKCGACGGGGYQRAAYTHAAASASGWKQPYRHAGGSGCPFCHNVVSHYHYPCTSCRGFGNR